MYLNNELLQHASLIPFYLPYWGIPYPSPSHPKVVTTYPTSVTLYPTNVTTLTINVTFEAVKHIPFNVLQRPKQ